MNVLSLCDGMSCGQIALQRMGIVPSKYYSSEIDSHTMAVTQYNYPKTVFLGDIANWKSWNIDLASIDLVIGGTPCQGFSRAGFNGGFDDPRSQAILHFFDILQSLRPDVKFLLENVVMKSEHVDVINNAMGVQPIAIDASLVSAQLRNRLYWCNWDVQQPADLGIQLKSIIDSGVVDREKSYCIDANYAKGVNLNQYVTKGRRQIVYEESGHKEEGGVHYRLLSPLECERAQTVPEGYTDVPGISKTQRYKMLGNGWCVDVITHILKAGI